MAHSEEHGSFSEAYPSYEAGKKNAAGLTCGSTWQTSRYGANPSRVQVFGRAASQHTVPDKHGWRPPTSYWGYRYFTCDSVEVLGTRPIVLNGTTVAYGNTQRLFANANLPMHINLFKVYRPSFPDLQGLAIQQALAALGSATAELGVELKEARKTAGLIEETLESLLDCVETVKRGRVPRQFKKAWRKWVGPKAPSLLANKWLEYRYGWTPMVLGVYDAMELLELQKDRILFTVRKRQVEDLTQESAPVATNWGGFYPLPVWYTTTTGEIKSVYVVLTFTARSELCATLNEAGVINPASVLWETIPFSFVVDWFVDVGGYFNAQAALRLYRLKGGTATHSHTWQSGRTISSRDYGVVKHCLPFSDVSAMAGGTAFSRVVLDENDLSATFAMGEGLDLKRSADLASLVYGALKGMLGRKTGLRL